MPGSDRVSVARSRREVNRFYCAPPLRKQQVDWRGPNLGTQSEKNAGPVSESDETALHCHVSRKADTACVSSNLDRFLESTTPRVPIQYLPKISSWFSWAAQRVQGTGLSLDSHFQLATMTSLSRCRTSKVDRHPYFVLGDLWDSFREWSAYGAGVPLLLNGSDSVVQYYVPYLSGIQLYRDPLRRPGEESDNDSSQETSSDGSFEGGPVIGANGAMHGVCKEPTNIDIQRFNGISVKDQPSSDSSCDEAEIPNPPSQLVFEYLERDPPYSREPLADKISMLASKFPELRTYRSCDLSSSSWISVAWYPIYRIPTGPTLQNLDACFLTYHFLSTCGNRSDDELPLNGTSVNEAHVCKTSSKLTLATFGLASYKFKISVWNPTGVEECPDASPLFRAADEWLRHLQVSEGRDRESTFSLKNALSYCAAEYCKLDNSEPPLIHPSSY